MELDKLKNAISPETYEEVRDIIHGRRPAQIPMVEDLYEKYEGAMTEELKEKLNSFTAKVVTIKLNGVDMRPYMVGAKGKKSDIDSLVSRVLLHLEGMVDKIHGNLLRLGVLELNMADLRGPEVIVVSYPVITLEDYYVLTSNKETYINEGEI